MAADTDERLKRDAFLYLDPKAPDDRFAQCNTCRDWIMEDDRCVIHAQDVRVPSSASCGFYIIGAPQVAGARCMGAVTPEESGLVDRAVRCENCRHFDDADSECNLFRRLNMYLPELFDLDESVDAKGCCNANQAKEA
jgi:hypothetical protein